MSAFALRLRNVRFPLRFGETLVGRSPYCSIVLVDPLLSREHASFQVTKSGLTVEDLGSRNGTRVNGQPIPGLRYLSPGDCVEVGGTLFEIEAVFTQDWEQTLRPTVSPNAGSPAPRPSLNPS